MTDLLTMGNAAKLYCLNWIAARAAQTSAALSILDLGCGTAANFTGLLRRYPTIHYTGVEPSAAACDQARANLTGLDAVIINGYAYDGIRAQLPRSHYDLVVSFSVFEHVYRRLAYLRLVRAVLAPGGHALINYDSGHFQSRYWKERLKNVIGPLLARLGQEGYFQAFVREDEFRRLAAEAGLTIAEAKSFNTALKGMYKHIPDAERPAYMERWLAFEEALNAAAIPYTDAKAALWYTRNFILTPTDG